MGSGQDFSLSIVWRTISPLVLGRWRASIPAFGAPRSSGGTDPAGPGRTRQRFIFGERLPDGECPGRKGPNAHATGCSRKLRLPNPLRGWAGSLCDGDRTSSGG
jgi:hypothetical protein